MTGPIEEVNALLNGMETSIQDPLAGPELLASWDTRMKSCLIGVHYPLMKDRRSFRPTTVNENFPKKWANRIMNGGLYYRVYALFGKLFLVGHLKSLSSNVSTE